MKHILVLLFFLNVTVSFGQTPTIGLVHHTDSVSSGYTLFSPDDNNNVYLIDNCGKLINEWVFNELPGITSYLLDNGNLLYAGKDSITIRDWNDNTLWSYATTANGIAQHHDIEPLPNGNILCIVTEFKTAAEQTSAGKDPALLGNNFKLDYIVELEPVGTNDANIVWEWHFWDHLVQDYSASENNFGVVADHSELINFNFNHGNINDWTHVNGIDYNANLDQIIISSKTMSELYIIDHSTSTAEAADHSGGTAGRGGDFLWRWGNSQVYGQGGAADQKLFGQHDGEWVHNNYMHEGKITVFNNGGDGTSMFSSIHLITPELNGTDYVMTSNTFAPNDFFYTWNGSAMTEVVFSTKKCGVQSLPTGGFLICDTKTGRFIEIDKDDNLVWMYVNPHGVGAVSNQFDILVGGNASFRAEKYQLDHPGILANTIVIGDIIENENSLSASCTDFSGIEEQQFSNFEVINPVFEEFITFTKPLSCHYTLIDMNGTIITEGDLQNTDRFYYGEVQSGVYLIRFQQGNALSIKRVVISK
ncbi:MAG: aryl-sulfate sulfotransferase [Crocinitomicaceae bacterium]|nr:aryl-sulfate sulfotransferase [Crocinitomicaceae bacterium]